MSSIDRDLEDPTKTCVYIPPHHTDERAPEVTPYPYHQWRDLSDGYERRMEVYKLSWTKCLNRVQSIVRNLHASIAANVAHEVTHAYTDILPGLPYPELPVIAVSSEGGSSSLYGLIVQELDRVPIACPDFRRPHRSMSKQLKRPQVIQNHLYPADCLTLTAMMKAVVTGFVDQDGFVSEPVKRKPTTSLANYDINLLQTWHSALGYSPHLVIFLHDFEQFDPAVVQDALYICSLHIPRLPLVFVLALSSPPTSPSRPSYLHATYPRDTLALLRVSMLSGPSGPAIVQEIIMKTFFDADFEPDIMLGPRVLNFIVDFSTRHCASVDGLISMLQLVYMRHFVDPITILTHPKASSVCSRLHDNDARQFMDVLQARILGSPAAEDNLDTDAILREVSVAHDAFRKKARGVRVAFNVMRIVKSVALERNTDAGGQADTADLEMLPPVLRGRLSKDIQYLGKATKKLSVQKLHRLLPELHAFFHNLESVVVRREEEFARAKIVSLMAQLPEPEDNPEVADVPLERPPAVVQIAAACGEWLTEFLEDHSVRLDECVLSDIWYTGNTPFPSELINPAPRPTVVAALLHPDEVVRAHAELLQAHKPAADRPSQSDLDEDDDGREPELWELPDTTILFRRFVEAGRMVNVYDWFESFKVVLEDQRRQLRHQARQRESAARKASSAPPAKTARRSKVKKRAEEMDTDEDVESPEGLDEEEMEQWSVEVQARFMRALHELDFTGFIKHTGRKADHVIRAIYDVPD